MPRSSQSAATSDSGDTSLSEFLAKRYHGTVPVFGGDPRTGARELGGAASADIVRAVSGLTSVLNRFALTQPSQVNSTDGPITTVDLSTELTSVEDACRLDDSKIEMLLSASMIDPRDTKRYALLLGTARTSLNRKRDAMVLQEQRKAARVTHKPVVSIQELILDELAKGRLKRLYEIFDLPHEFDRDNHTNRVMLMAITHDSWFAGRETNRVLAHMGDSALKLAAAQHCFDTLMPVSDVSDIVQSTQTDAQLAEVGKAKGLHDIIFVQNGVDAGAKKIVATVVEAIIGAIYYLHGEKSATNLASQLGVIKSLDTTPTL